MVAIPSDGLLVCLPCADAGRASWAAALDSTGCSKHPGGPGSGSDDNHRDRNRALHASQAAHGAGGEALPGPAVLSRTAHMCCKHLEQSCCLQAAASSGALLPADSSYGNISIASFTEHPAAVSAPSPGSLPSVGRRLLTHATARGSSPQLQPQARRLTARQSRVCAIGLIYAACLAVAKSFRPSPKDLAG